MDRIEDVQFEVYLLNKHRGKGELYLEAKNWANNCHEVVSCRGIFIQSRFNLIKKLIKLLIVYNLKLSPLSLRITEGEIILEYFGINVYTERQVFFHPFFLLFAQNFIYFSLKVIYIYIIRVIDL